MKRVYILFLTIILSLQFGCQKYLDIQPKGYLIPSTVEDYERILNNRDLQWSISTTLDILSDDSYIWSVEPPNIPVNSTNQAYQWSEDIFLTASELQDYSFYNRLYENIYQYNAIINNIDNATGGTLSRKIIAKAKAKVLRAFSFWYLVNLYAKQYNNLTASADLGIPLIMGTDLNQEIPGRGTVQQDFDFILSEINESIPLLPTSGSNLFDLDQRGAYGILARIYLSMENYPEAGKAAGEVLARNNTLVDYNSYYATYNNRGLTFIYMSSTSPFSTGQSPEDIFIRYYNSSRGMAGNGIAQSVVNLFPDNDLRRVSLTPESVWTATPGVSTGNYYYMYYILYQYSIGITVPEMYLIRAEANARAGNIAAALNDVNTLRRYRIKTSEYQEITASTETEAVQTVLLERRKELLFKGARWFDMRRLNADPVYGFTPRHYFADGTFVELMPNSNRYVLRFPQSAVQQGITQNP